MKYKQKKTNVSKYITATSKKESSKKSALKWQIKASVALVVIMFLISGLGIIKRPVIKSVFGYVTKVSDIFSPHKLKNSEFLKNTGEHIFDFCFGYLKDDNTPKANASAKSPKEEVTQTLKPALPSDGQNISEPIAVSDAQTVEKADTGLKFEPVWPCEGEVSSEFGSRIHPVTKETRFHNGIDIAVDEGTQIFACEDGVVEIAEYNEYSGNFAVLSHDGGYASSYSHMSYLFVTEGTSVKKGDLIGLAGSTGVATGPHLHFEIKQDGICKDPKEFLAAGHK